MKAATSPRPSPPEVEREGQGALSCGDLFGGSGGAVVLVGVGGRVEGDFVSLSACFLLAQGFGGTRKPDIVFLFGFVLPAWEGLTARVLPAFAGVVPMETKLREIGADALKGLLGEGDPDPFAHYFGKLELGRHPPAEFFEDFFNREFSIEIAFGKIDVRLYAFAGVRSLEFGVRAFRFLSRCRCGCRCRVLSGQLLGSVLEL